MKNESLAFPYEFKYSDGTAERSEGMTLRDYFAGQALIGKSHWRAMKTIEEQELAADECYSIADAMIAARTKNLTSKSTTE